MVPPAALCHPLGPFRAPKVEAPLSVGMPSAELASPTAPTTLSFRVGAGASCGIHLPVAGGGDPRMAALMRMPLSAAAAIACQFSEQAAADVLLSGGVRVAPDTSGPRANGDGPRFTALVQLDPLKDAEVKAKTTFSHQLQCVRVHATHLTNSGDSAPKEVDVFTGEGPLLARLAVVAPELLFSGQLSPDGHYRGYTVRLLHSQTDFRPICSALPGLLVIDRKAHWLSRLEPLLHLPGVVLGGGKAALLPPATDSASLRLSHRLDCLADGYILLDPGVPLIERATFGPEGGVTWTSVGGAAGSFPPVCRVVVAMHESVQATDGPLRGRHLVAWSATPIAMTRVGGIMGANGKPLTVLSSEMTPNVRGPPPSVDVSSSPPFAAASGPPAATLPRRFGFLPHLRTGDMSGNFGGGMAEDDDATPEAASRRAGLKDELTLARRALTDTLASLGSRSSRARLLVAAYVRCTYGLPLGPDMVAAVEGTFLSWTPKAVDLYNLAMCFEWAARRGVALPGPADGTIGATAGFSTLDIPRSLTRLLTYRLAGTISPVGKLTLKVLGLAYGGGDFGGGPPGQVGPLPRPPPRPRPVRHPPSHASPAGDSARPGERAAPSRRCHRPCHPRSAFRGRVHLRPAGAAARGALWRANHLILGHRRRAPRPAPPARRGPARSATS